ncbi:hypothetical protein D3C78_1963610 [compost metagenome]
MEFELILTTAHKRLQIVCRYDGIPHLAQLYFHVEGHGSRQPPIHLYHHISEQMWRIYDVALNSDRLSIER